MEPILLIGIVAFVLIVIVLARRQRIDKISETNNQTGSEPIIPRSAQLYNSLKWIFLIIGIGSIITGLFSVYGYFFSDLTIYQSKIGIYGTIFNFSFGAINLICYWLYINRKIIIVWVYGASILLSMIYSYAMGRGFNFPMALIGGYIIYQLINLSKENELGD